MLSMMAKNATTKNPTQRKITFLFSFVPCQRLSSRDNNKFIGQGLELKLTRRESGLLSNKIYCNNSFESAWSCNSINKMKY